MPPRRSGLQLGVLDVCSAQPGKPSAMVLDETVELAVAAERLGYSRFWVAEHHGPGSAQASPEILVASIAARTRRIRVGSGGVLLPLYSPLKVAESFRLLSALHPGRIELGVGRGEADERTTLALRGSDPGVPYGERVALLRAFLREEQDAAHPFAGVLAVPRGVSPPPLWVLGSGAGSVEVAAKNAAGFAFALFLAGGLADGTGVVRAYREAFAPSRHMQEPAVAVAVGVVCAEDDEAARRLAATVANPYLRHSVVGTPEACRAALDGIARDYGTTDVLVTTMVPDFAARKRSYELLIEAAKR